MNHFLKRRRIPEQYREFLVESVDGVLEGRARQDGPGEEHNVHAGSHGMSNLTMIIFGAETGTLAEMRVLLPNSQDLAMHAARPLRPPPPSPNRPRRLHLLRRSPAVLLHLLLLRTRLGLRHEKQAPLNLLRHLPMVVVLLLVWAQCHHVWIWFEQYGAVWAVARALVGDMSFYCERGLFT